MGIQSWIALIIVVASGISLYCLKHYSKNGCVLAALVILSMLIILPLCIVSAAHLLGMISF